MNGLKRDGFIGIVVVILVFGSFMGRVTTIVHEEQDRSAPGVYETHGEEQEVQLETQVHSEPKKPVHSYGLDTDDNSLYDYLIVEFPIEVNQSANYNIYSGLKSLRGASISYASSYLFLAESTEQVSMAFKGIEINWGGVDGPYNATISIYSDCRGGICGNSVYDSSFETSYYKSTEFEKPKALIEFIEHPIDYGKDTDNDGLYNYLTFEFTVNIARIGAYSFYLHMEPLNTANWHWPFSSRCLDVGEHNLSMDFRGDIIHTSGRTEGFYNATISGQFEPYYQPGCGPYHSDGYDYVYDSMYFQTHYYMAQEFEEQEPPLTFTGHTEDSGVDDDGDGLYERLLVETEVNVTQEGPYYLSAFLYSLSATNTSEIRIATDIDWNLYLAIGLQIIHIAFNGNSILQSNISGPYFVEISLVPITHIDPSTTYITRYYSCAEFESVPELTIESIQEYVFDYDDNVLYNYLGADIAVEVNIEGIYQVSALLYSINSTTNSSEDFITYYAWSYYLTENSNALHFYFSGPEIYHTGIDGPYLVKISIIPKANPISLDAEYITNYYSYTQFDHY